MIRRQADRMTEPAAHLGRGWVTRFACKTGTARVTFFRIAIHLF